MAEKPRSIEYEPAPGVERTNAIYKSHTVAIHDMRPAAADLSLDEEGFQLITVGTDRRDFRDADAIRSRYYPQAVEVLQQMTGAERIVVFDHTIRHRVAGAADRTNGVARQPVPRVHNDYTRKSGPQRVRDLLGGEAEHLLRGRFAVINVWRPLRGPVLDSPLAVCDARSVDPGDLVATDLVYPEHRWFYAPAMRQDEVILIKCFDSADDGRARFVPHSAFCDPTTPANAPPRQSIELRTLVFYPN
jgi:hypothetical protein